MSEEIKSFGVLDKFRNDVAAQLATITGASAEAILPAVEECKKKELGDFSVNAARLMRLVPGAPKGKPVDFAAQWVAAFKPSALLEAATTAGPYMNFSCSTTELAKAVCASVTKFGEKYGTSNEGAGKKVIVEYSSPNIAKPFHAGHLRSTILGNFLVTTHKAGGFDVIGINWLGDWGVQFGKLAVGFEKWGNEEALQKEALRHLYEVYVKVNAACNEDKVLDKEAHEFFRKMEDGEEASLKVWNRFRDLSISDLNKTYKRLNIAFDVISGESHMNHEIEDEALATLKEKGLLREDQGATIVPLKEVSKLPNAILRKSDDTTLYLTRDIAAAIERYREFHFEKMFYVVSAQQSLHFEQLFKTLELMGHDWAKKCVHVPFGMVKGMSTRKGTAVFLDDILNEARSTMLEVMSKNTGKIDELDEDPEKVADVVGVSAVVVQDFNARRIKDYDFQWARMTSFEGHTGPYLQYAHARLCSVERKCGFPLNPAADVTLLKEKEAHILLMEIARFPEVIRQAREALEPITLVSYLYDLAHAISVAHSALWVKGREQDLADARLMLYHVARVTLGNGLRIIGLTPLERM